jgi:hypothetical protein
MKTDFRERVLNAEPIQGLVKSITGSLTMARPVLIQPVATVGFLTPVPMVPIMREGFLTQTTLLPPTLTLRSLA